MPNSNPVCFHYPFVSLPFPFCPTGLAPASGFFVAPPHLYAKRELSLSFFFSTSPPRYPKVILSSYDPQVLQSPPPRTRCRIDPMLSSLVIQPSFAFLFEIVAAVPCYLSVLSSTDDPRGTADHAAVWLFSFHYASGRPALFFCLLSLVLRLHLVPKEPCKTSPR